MLATLKSSCDTLKSNCSLLLVQLPWAQAALCYWHLLDASILTVPVSLTKQRAPRPQKQEELLPWLPIFSSRRVMAFNGAGEGRGAGGTPAGRAGFQDHGDPRAPVAEPPGHRGDSLPGSSGEQGTEGRGKREEKRR